MKGFHGVHFAVLAFTLSLGGIEHRGSYLPAPTRATQQGRTAGSGPCTVDGSATDCVGVVPAGTPSIDDLRKAAIKKKKVAFLPGLPIPNGVYRKVDCPGKVCSDVYVHPFVNPDAWNFKYPNIKPGYGIVFSAVRYDVNGAYNEHTYGFGKGLDGGEGEEPGLVFFVGYPDLLPGSDPANTVAVGSWKAFGIFGGNGTPEVRPLMKGQAQIGGKILECTFHHPENPLNPISRFRNCASHNFLATLSLKSGISMMRFSDTETSVIAASRDNRTATPEFIHAAIRKAFEGILREAHKENLIPLLAQAAFDDPSLDPYWFSCASGCCTAGT